MPCNLVTTYLAIILVWQKWQEVSNKLLLDYKVYMHSTEYIPKAQIHTSNRETVSASDRAQNLIRAISDLYIN